MTLLLLAACFGAPESEDSGRPPREGNAQEGDDVETERGSIVRLVTRDVIDIAYGENPTLEPPENGTFLRVDSCSTSADFGFLCEDFDGSWYLFEDGSITLSPSSWDGPDARVTWLVIE